MLTLTWVTRNKELQADVPVGHFAASVRPPVGLLTVLTGLPSGAWVPAGNHAVELINGAPEVPGATDWSVTITP